ncbi:ATP-dependent DNA helicase RecG [Bifidobacterium sp. 64T4]|uniref:ATP-dependent DNA helicase RecG n=1 Tax=Bifidobacterium pongonis TaxID=2834432 RepID=UPI001C57BE1B|nr:ATP-dependent DNA helicase RecG [Bifidobacterium pongonis]MBW3094474.1 ATP-dependent DNA helicase RecG [Bifidobacterium pongonis]
MSISLDTPIGSLLSNTRRVSTLKSFGIVSVGDALTYYPFRVGDPVPPRAIREARPATAMAFAAVVTQSRVIPMNARRGYRLEAVVEDSAFAATRGMPAGMARLVFFSNRRGYVDWMAMRLAVGTQVIVSGMPSEYMGQLQFTHPDIVTVAPAEIRSFDVQPVAAEPTQTHTRHYDVASVKEGLDHVCRPRPVYHASARLSSDRIHETIVGLLNMLGGRETVDLASAGTPLQGFEAEDEQRFAAALGEAIPDILPEHIRAERGLMHRAEAFRAIHDPISVEAFHKGIGTLRYEEAFICQTALLQARNASGTTPAHVCAGNGGDDQGEGLVDRFIASLPFQLTEGQREVIGSIRSDMARNHPMQRLLQGEVGSGKTVVALAAMLQAVEAGYQAVLVAPTLVLAEQHAETIRTLTQGLESPPIPVTLITGGMKLAARRKAHAMAASGEPGIIVATHAAFSSTFQASNLALVVIDEQHRFGVEQRESLQTKPADGSTPHMLIMTATPIPRTAAMTWFGDLDISWLTELPGGRKPIRTFVINEEDGRTMASMFTHIRSHIDAGERAYIVCARIDDTSDGKKGGKTDDDMALDPYAIDDGEEAQARPPLHTVAEIAERLQKLPQFQGIKFATLTGRDKDEVKTQVMADFASGKTPVLVSTTVIEVGVDVKQASCIVIFDADRYGLSQLHQLRGRVGRGGTNSWAFLISRAEAGSPAEARLQVIHDSLDGAQIAQADLEFRGAGDVLGDTQSGMRSSLKLLRVVQDADLIVDARSRAERLLAEDPQLEGSKQLAGAVLDFTRGNEAFLTSN